MELSAELSAEDQRALATDFSQAETQRSEVGLYAPLLRDIRLCRGLFRIEAEQRAYIQDGKAIKLARLPARSGRLSSLFSFWRRS